MYRIKAVTYITLSLILKSNLFSHIRNQTLILFKLLTYESKSFSSIESGFQHSESILNYVELIFYISLYQDKFVIELDFQ